jgi:putative phage-type endonuclease
MKHDMEQRTEEWFKARLGKVTASKMNDVLSKIKSGEAAMRKNYKMQLATERLTGKQTDFYMNQAMQDGIDREDTARQIFEIVRDIKVEQVGFIDHPTIKMSGASPDGLLPDGGILEIKCPIETTHTTNLLERKLPSRYLPQVQWQLSCAGKDYKYANFVSYNPNFEPKLQLIYVEVERDEDYIAMLEEEVAAFITEVDDIVNQLRELTKE